MEERGYTKNGVINFIMSGEIFKTQYLYGK